MLGSTGEALAAAVLVVGGGGVSWGVHPLAPMAAPKPSVASRTVLIDRLRFSPECMGVKLAPPRDRRRSYPQLDLTGFVLASIGA